MKTASESHRILIEVYGEHAPPKGWCKTLFKCFKRGDFCFDKRLSIIEDDKVVNTRRVNHARELLTLIARGKPVPFPAPEKYFCEEFYCTTFI